MIRALAAMLALFLTMSGVVAWEAVSFKAADGLIVSADVYREVADENAPWIVLTHQAGASRGEYREIAPRLNKLGFNAIAIDQRSGKAFGDVRNETAQRAATRGARQSYSAAVPDIEAAIAWARAQTSGPVVLWGSSYSAALAIWMAGQQPGLVNAVIAMSPGEYIRGRSIVKAAASITVPALIASSASERGNWRKIFKAIAHDRKVGFTPKSGGRHGSSALIPLRNRSSEDYWTVVKGFLTMNVAKK
jgi:dienelactone hydrolase